MRMGTRRAAWWIACTLVLFGCDDATPDMDAPLSDAGPTDAATADGAVDATTPLDVALSDAAVTDASRPDAAPFDAAPSDAALDMILDDAAPDAAPTDMSAVDAQQPDGAPPAPLAGGTLFAWRGLDHDWLRTVVGFRVPHRISRLDTAVLDPAADAATAVFAQSTGVDGNFMDPVLAWEAAEIDDVAITHASAVFEFDDDVEGDPYPQARTELRRAFEVPLPPEATVGEAILRGVRLTARCDDARQPPDEPCNSDGLWPFRFAVGLDDCAVADGALRCTVAVDLHRAWTPNRGGIRGIEEKPLNDVLSYRLEVLYSTIAGRPDALGVQRSSLTLVEAPARQNAAPTAAVRLEGDGDAGLVGVTRFGFEFLRTGNADARGHLGRYIGRLNFGVEGDFDPAAGAAEVTHRTQVWIPDTVAQTDARYEMQSTLLTFGGRSTGRQTVTGEICRNSSDQAPLLTRWERCGGGDRGPEQVEDRIGLDPAMLWR